MQLRDKAHLLTIGQDGLVGDEINTVASDREGNMWFSSYGSICKYDGTTWTYFLVGGIVTSLTIGNDGNLWIGTIDDGLRKFDGTTWTQYTNADGLVSNSVRLVVIDNQGDKWIETGRGVSVLNSSTLPGPDGHRQIAPEGLVRRHLERDIVRQLSYPHLERAVSTGGR